ncbi:uncharacterized protein PF3D7_1120600 [Polyergus mexicanus]|uniref:uncharacterized protein PF3D7_1120600 n=1 Tax=Polyergus mexicanus TaxID=615972 RepID=UPI0038B45251
MIYHRQYVGLLLQVIHFIANCLAENLILNVNCKKPIAVTSDAFLSFTLDPATLLHSTDALTKNIERSANMARGLVPAYVRLGGPQSNSYIFERAYLHNADVDSSFNFVEKQWTLIHQWTKNVGLDMIISIAPRYIENESEMHSKNSTNITEFLSFNDFMGYNVSWQLGYECQTKCNLSGGDLGQYVANFREILKTFPRYSNSLITGPDIVAYRTAQEQKYLQDYLNSADAALSAITWHPDFASVSLNNDSVSMHYDNMIADKNELYKIISHTARRKPLWIAESKPEKFKHEYLGALIWTTRLGDAAKLGVQVLMRQPSNFYKATPDYWVSLLHKALVGRQVLELKVHSNNGSYVHLYSQCTKPSALYDKGAITIFGVNLTPKEVTANLKGLKIETLHRYILSPDSKTGNKLLSEKVLLNDKPLDLINDKELPNLNPEIIIKSDGLELKLSSGDIGFWVIPNAKVKACVYSEEETAENIIQKRLSKRHKNIIQQDNQERKINDMKHYRHPAQESERIKRDIGRKLIEIGPRMDNVLKKRLKFDNVRDNMNERKTKRKDDFRRDELLTPFNPRITDSDENNFYGFFRRNPTKGFPESDILITMGDSSEQNSKDYDYVQDENDENDSTAMNMQHTKELTQKHVEDNTWIEMENDHVPNEFFENVKFFNTRIKENPKSYGDLLEAEFFPQTQLPDEKKKKRAIEKGMQKLINYYDFKEQEHDGDIKYEALGLASRRSSKPLSQLVETPIYIDHQASNIKPKETKLKVESGLKDSSFFYQPSQTATVNSNYNNYNNIKNMRYEKTNVNKEKILAVNISNNRDNINTETYKFSRPADINTGYHIFHNRRAKRSNQAKIQKLLAEEMIKENEENTKDCHCRIIRASQLSKKLCYCRVKRDNQIFVDSSSEVKSVNVENAQSERNVENSMAKEENENIIAGEILPSTSVIESDYEEHDITTGTITTESSTLDYRPSYETQMIDINSTSIMDNSEINNTSEQHHNVDEFDIKKLMVNSEFSPNNGADSNSNDIVNNDATKEMLFRAKSPDIQSENETTTYDPSQVVSKILSNNKSNPQEVIASATEYAQETTREKTQNFINKKRRTNSYSTATKNQKDKERRDNNYKNSLKSMNSLETMQKIAEEQTTTETILSKLIAGAAVDNSESNESKIKSEDNTQHNVEDNLNKDNQDIDVNSTSIMDNSEINNTSEQHHNVDEFDIKKLMVNSEFSPNNGADSNSNDIVNNDVTKEMLFRAKSPDIQSENETTTYDPSQVVSKILSNNKSNPQEVIASATEYAQETTREKTQNFINKKRRTNSYSTATKNQKDKERRDNNYKNSLKSMNSLETMQKIAEEQTTTETILSKLIAGAAVDNSESNESKIKSEDNTQHNVEDNLNKDNQDIVVNSTSIMDNSEINNTSEQHHNVDEFDIKKLMVNSEFSPNNGADSNSNDIVNNDVTKEMLFRAKSPDIQSENETTTYDPSQVVSKILSNNKSNPQEVIASATEYAQETTREKTQNFINKKRRTNSYSTATKNQKDKERRDNNYKISLKSTNSLETMQKIAEEQTTTETILSKLIAGAAVDNSESNESKIKSEDNTQHNVEDNQNKDNQDIESGAGTQLKKNIATKKLKTIFRTTPLRGHTRRDEYLNRRAEQTNKLKEKLYARRKRLLQQYRHELMKIADEQKRNLKRRETWERFRENDDLRHLIDQGEFVGILIDNDIIYKDNNNEKYEIPVKLVPKQYENIPDQIYTPAKVKEEHYPKYNKYYQFPRHLEVTEDDGESKFISLDRKYNQYYEYLPRIIKDEQELAKASRFSEHERNQDRRYFEKIIEDGRESKAASKSYGRRIFAIDPSTYRGGEPILQSHENHSKLPKYYSEIKSENQNPVPRWIYQVLSKSILKEDQRQASKLQEYMKKTSIKNDEENADVIYIFDAQKRHDRPNDLELNNIYRNLKREHDNLDMPIADKRIKLTKDVRIGKYIDNEKFVDSHDEKENILNVKKTKDTKNAEKLMNPKNNDTDKEEMLNIKKFKDITESESKTEHLNDKRKNIYKIAQEINNLNEKIQNDINTKMSKNNEAIKDVKKIITNDSELSKLGNARTRRDIKKQRSDEYLERLLYFLLTKTNIRDGSNYDTYDHLKEDPEEIFNKQSIPFYRFTKNDELPLNNILFRKSKNCLNSSERDLEIDQDEKNEKDESPKYIVFIPTKDNDSYKMLKVKNYDDSLSEKKTIEIPYFDENQYLLRKLSDSIMGNSDDESSEELVYEDLSDLLNERIENISDKKIYSSESVQDISIDVKDSGINDESEKEEEQYKSEEIRYLGMKNQMRSDECGMVLLLPWEENEKKIRQRREIRNRINGGKNQMKSEVNILLIQSKSNKFILTENIKNEDIKNSLNKNNIDKQEKEKIITRNSTETDYLETQIDKKYRDDLLEDFIRTQKLTPKLQNAIIGGLENTQNTTESMEPFIGNFQGKYNGTVLISDKEKHLKNETSEIIGNPFHIAIINIKKIIAFLSEISRIFM